MGIVIGAVAVVFVLALIIFPGVRGKLKVLVGGFLNIFVEDIAKTPEGAKAVFQQAIEEVQERYNKAGDTLNRFVGEQSSVQKNLNKLYGELKDVESKCESLVRSGNMADAAIFSTRREEILFEISQKEGYLREIEPMVKEAQTVYEAYDKKLRELKKQSRMTVEFVADTAQFKNPEEAYAIMDEFVSIANTLDGAIIQVEGNINARNYSDSGQALSAERAKAVAKYFIACGIDPNRLITVGNGNTKMVADPGSADAYLNRRTDVFFKIIEE